MNAKTQEKLRKQLEVRKTEIEDNVSYMADEIRAIGIDQDDENGSLGNHIADDGSNVSEAERLVVISEDFQEILGQINAALERMEEGTYGICLRCGKPIAAERLKAFPYVAYCIECQSIIEREQALRAGA
ncbi:MAG: transcriptional regulator, TraR/DksA family [Thermomicrobiales bacterium]|jgi:DnaK suppressor protein|nr:transcriptional regulator, TraR/DksA family [Thermomicrobiales bacterium]MDF3042978.1 transcriptional regulator, TraR/DksA family [Thermomicrobiales bacterium]